MSARYSAQRAPSRRAGGSRACPVARAALPSLVPETLRAMEADEELQRGLAALRETGGREAARQEAARRRRALSGVPSFDAVLADKGCAPLEHAPPTTLQVNLGLYCNQACSHCHVESSPLRREAMDAATLERLFALLAASPGVRTLDLTGGAPELHPLFRGAVARAAGLGLRVLVRSNLTVLLEPGQEDLATFLASHRVRVVASLPCYEEGAVDAQRGAGVYARSITALQALNAAGYATPGTGLHLDLMYNPAGATLPPPQAALEAAYRAELRERHGVAFTRLLTLTNMPIKRFADRLHQSGQAESYLRLLLSAFNVATLPGLMCTNLVSVDWRGRLYDCDFNQALGLGEAGARDVWSLESLDDVAGSRVATGLHCLGCTAGAGSSCGGQLA